MTNGSSQGLFVVVGIIIFGIFVSLSYSLFRDTLTPSLASIFQESTTMPTTFYLPDTPKGAEYTHTKIGDAGLSTSGFEEFVHLVNYDLSKLGDVYPENTIFEITFSLKTTKEGKVLVYCQSGAGTKYQMAFEKNNYTGYASVVNPEGNTFNTYTLKFKLKNVNDSNHRGDSLLAFYSFYGSANKVTVKDISIRRVGNLK